LPILFLPALELEVDLLLVLEPGNLLLQVHFDFLSLQIEPLLLVALLLCALQPDGGSFDLSSVVFDLVAKVVLSLGLLPKVSLLSLELLDLAFQFLNFLSAILLL
jgi:hypothetical protein